MWMMETRCNDMVCLESGREKISLPFIHFIPLFSTPVKVSYPNLHSSLSVRMSRSNWIKFKSRNGSWLMAPQRHGNRGCQAANALAQIQPAFDPPQLAITGYKPLACRQPLQYMMSHISARTCAYHTYMSQRHVYMMQVGFSLVIET